MSIVYPEAPSRYAKPQKIEDKLHVYEQPRDRKIHVNIGIAIDRGPSSYSDFVRTGIIKYPKDKIYEEFTAVLFVKHGDPIVSDYEDLPEYTRQDLKVITDYLLDSFLQKHPGYCLRTVLYFLYDTDCEKFVGEVNKRIGS